MISARMGIYRSGFEAVHVLSYLISHKIFWECSPQVFLVQSGPEHSIDSIYNLSLFSLKSIIGVRPYDISDPFNPRERLTPIKHTYLLSQFNSTIFQYLNLNKFNLRASVYLYHRTIRT